MLAFKRIRSNKVGCIDGKGKMVLHEILQNFNFVDNDGS